MPPDIHLPLIMLAALAVQASPGPATLAIAGTSLNGGRRAGLAVASGITTGSLVWSISAALGLGTLMAAAAWPLEVVRYLGGCYLLFLAAKSARAALRRTAAPVAGLRGDRHGLYRKGVLLHLTNPKAILFFGALYSIGLPPGASWSQLALVVLVVGLQGAAINHGYALLFSTPRLARGYARLRRGFDGVMALGFALAGVKVLTARLS